MENVKVYAAKGSFRQSIHLGKHSLVSDAPLGSGGTASGPEPHDFVSVALATCTSMTLQMYAKRKEIPLEGVHVEVHFKKTSEGGTLFEKKITLEGALSDEQRLRLIEISDKCPVYKMLTGSISVQNVD